MPYVPVPKDLTKVKTKLAFNLTKRQLICFSLAGLVGLPVYFFTRGAIGNSAAAAGAYASCKCQRITCNGSCRRFQRHHTANADCFPGGRCPENRKQ